MAELHGLQMGITGHLFVSFLADETFIFLRRLPLVRWTGRTHGRAHSRTHGRAHSRANAGAHGRAWQIL